MKRYSKWASKKVERAMRERKKRTHCSGRSGKKVTSRKQAIAIGLFQAPKEDSKVPPAPRAPNDHRTRASPQGDDRDRN